MNREARPQLVFSARERNASIAASVRLLSRALIEADRRRDAGWLLLSVVAPEIIRTEALASPAKALARDAGELLAAGQLVTTAAEVFLAIGDEQRALALLHHFGEEALIAKVKAFDDPPQLLVQSGLTGTPDVASPDRVREGAATALEGAEALLDADRLLPLLELLGLMEQAARLAAAQGDTLRAARAWLAAGDRVAAARAFGSAGELNEALNALLPIAADHPEYRVACIFAARLATRLDRVDFELFHMIGEFVGTAPANKAESDAMAMVAELFQRHGQTGLVDSDRGHRSKAAPALKLPEAEYQGEPLPSLTPDLEEEADPISALPSGPEDTLVRSQSPPQRLGTAAVAGFVRPHEASEGGPRPILSEQDLIGLVLAGRYGIEAELGRGGTSVVYQAVDLILNEPVALKFLLGAARDPQAVNRFRREIKLARRLTHPNIVRIFDLGEDRGTLYLSMELLHGVPLRAMGRSDLPPRRVAEIIRQAAAGLHSAHDLGVVHRDVKPDNLFLTQDGTVKVMDFGLAWAAETPVVTVPGLIAGTPTFMAPEQVDNFSTATPAVDQYSLAVVAYLLLTGRPPFAHRELFPLLRMHAEQRPPPPSSIESSLGTQVDEVLLRALSKKAEERYPSCVDFAEALEVALQAGSTPA